MNRSSTVAPVLAVVALFAGEAALGRAVSAQATLSLTPTSQDFGSVALGVNSAVVVFTVVNRGTAPTKGLSVGLGGNGASNFAIGANSCGAALSPGGTCTVSVSFSPRAVGVKAASLDIKAGPGGMLRSNLSGTGNSGMLTCATGQTMQNGVCVNLTAGTTTTTCPTGVASGTGGCIASTLSVGPASRDFGSLQAGAASTAYIFSVVNISTASLSGISVTLSGINAASFAIASNTCAGLPPGGTCAVGVRFSPTSVGVNTASLNVTATGGSARASLTGTGAGTVSCSTGQTMQNGVCVYPVAGTTTGACPTGYVANGTGGCTMMTQPTCPTGQTMQNGVCVYPVAGSTTGACPTGYVANGTGGCTMMTQPTCPTGQAMQNGVCVYPVAGSTTGACPTGYVANGTGGCTMMTQPTCPTGQTMQNGVCVYPVAGSTTGACPTGYVANGTGGCTMMTQTTCPTGQTMQNGVCVYPAAGTTTGACPAGYVANGTGGCTMMTQPTTTLSVGPASRDFGTVQAGAASTAFIFNVVNISTASLSGISVTLSGVNAASFAIASNTCAGLPPGGTCAVGVRFSPTSVGVKTASLNVTATGGSPLASLTGTAIP